MTPREVIATQQRCSTGATYLAPKPKTTPLTAAVLPVLPPVTIEAELLLADLCALADNGLPLPSLPALAQKMGCKQHYVARLLRCLELSGLVTRLQSSNGWRSLVITLTQQTLRRDA